MVTKANATLRTGALLQRTYSNSWLCSLQEGSTHEMRNGSLLTLVVCICFTQIHFCSTAESERPFVLYLSIGQARSLNSMAVGKWLKMRWECHSVWRVARVNTETFTKLLRTELNEDKLQREQHQLRSLDKKFKNCFFLNTSLSFSEVTSTLNSLCDNASLQLFILGKPRVIALYQKDKKNVLHILGLPGEPLPVTR